MPETPETPPSSARGDRADDAPHAEGAGDGAAEEPTGAADAAADPDTSGTGPAGPATAAGDGGRGGAEGVLNGFAVRAAAEDPAGPSREAVAGGDSAGSGPEDGTERGAGEGAGGVDGIADGPGGRVEGGDGVDGVDPVGLVEDAVLAAAGRATLAFQAARADRSFGTAFWYNDLVETGAGHEVIRQYLVAAASRTRYELGQFTLREGLVAPELPADELVLPSFAKKWTVLGRLGVAVMPTTDLHIHAEKSGWKWTTDEVTAGLAAQPADIALIGAEPLPAYVLGHAVDEEAGGRHPERPQVLLPGAVTRTSDDPTAPVRWTTPLPEGFAGAPVFAALPMDDGQVKLVCLGLVLPAPAASADAAPVEPAPDGAPDATTPAASATVVTFDLLRPAIHAVTPSRRRRWWQVR